MFLRPFPLLFSALAMLFASAAIAQQAPATEPAATSSAEPPEQAFTIGPEPAWLLMGGLLTGGAFGSLDTGGFLGGELSLARLSDGGWAGLYVDGAWDFGPDLGTFSVGPEIGAGVLGLDGGLGIRVGGDETDLGVRGRVLLTLMGLSLFGRYGYWPDSGATHEGQVGLLFKMPLGGPYGLEYAGRAY